MLTRTEVRAGGSNFVCTYLHLKREGGLSGGGDQINIAVYKYMLGNLIAIKMPVRMRLLMILRANDGICVNDLGRSQIEFC